MLFVIWACIIKFAQVVTQQLAQDKKKEKQNKQNTNVFCYFSSVNDVRLDYCNFICNIHKMINY